MSKYDGIPTIEDYIADRAVGCRKCGDSFERAVRPDGTVEACEDCGDGEYSLYAAAETERERVELIEHLYQLELEIAAEQDYQIRGDLQLSYDAAYERLQQLEEG